MWNNQRPNPENGASASAAADGDNNNNHKDDDKVVKTAGFVVLSGIAMSILKALNPYNNKNNNTMNNITTKLTESTQSPLFPTQPLQHLYTSMPIPPPPTEEPIIKIPEKTVVVESSASKPSPRTVKIVKGDTLWGLSREYGVSIEAIKEANGLTGDTIYAGKKLIIP